ncbi:MAG: SufD family Fe-S cluster assembly protein [Hyphomonadaceae bacterium]|nr:SufD family Fe-S cluster assembly protein [Hyphomonadaceae bacterium]
MIDALPTRRDEAWKYSDLRAALREDALVLRPGRDIIERLAPGVERITVGPGETRTLVEIMDGAAFDARAVEIDIAAGGAVQRVIVQTGTAPVLSMARVALGEGAAFRQFIYAEGAKLARIETHVAVGGPQAHVGLDGAYLVGAGRHADLTSVIDMQAPHGQARQLIKGAARRGGRGVFQGKIHVARAAQKTDARQHHHALMLEEGAEIDAKPELEIYADDVACAHGNACGGLDAQALFYLRARGIPEAQARALLVEAFVAEALPDWLPGETRSAIETRIAAWLEAAP